MLEVNDSNFEAEVLKSTDLVLVDFWADWCVPCKQMMPHLEAIESQYTDVKFTKFLADKNSEIVRKYGIRSVPTMMFFLNGEVLLTVNGAQTKEKLKTYLDAL